MNFFYFFFGAGLPIGIIVALTNSPVMAGVLSAILAIISTVAFSTKSKSLIQSDHTKVFGIVWGILIGGFVVYIINNTIDIETSQKIEDTINLESKMDSISLLLQRQRVHKVDSTSINQLNTLNISMAHSDSLFLILYKKLLMIDSKLINASNRDENKLHFYKDGEVIVDDE